MSQDNVEIVRRVYAAINGRRTDALEELMGPGFQWEPNPDDPEREPRHGLEQTSRALEAQWRALPRLHTEIEEIVDGGTVVVVMVLHTAVVPGSDDQITRKEAHVWRLQNGRIVGLREFGHRKQALEAAGLSE